MFDISDRIELLEILDKEYNDARWTIANDGYIPSSMHRTGGRVGVTIEFRKLYNKLVRDNQISIED